MFTCSGMQKRPSVASPVASSEVGEPKNWKSMSWPDVR